MHKVFVYGTLRKGELNDHLMRGATCIAEQCWTYGELYDTGYGYPAIKRSFEAKVHGELYEVSDNGLLNLDQLEEYTEGAKDNLYDRVVQEIQTEAGTISAYVYIAARENLLKNRIVTGDWKLNYQD